MDISIRVAGMDDMPTLVGPHPAARMKKQLG